MKILNFGSLNLDNVYHVDHFVRAGETLSSDAMHIYCGGKGLNQSIALARSGAKVFHAGAIGLEDGNILKEALKRNGVNIDHLFQLKDKKTGHAIIQIDKSGQNCILLFPGANHCITREHIDKTLENFSKGDLLILQNEINNIDYIINQAHEKGMQIVLNPSPMNEKILALPLEYVDYFILNEVEMADISEDDNEEKGLQSLKEKYPNASVVLTLGSRGVRFENGSLSLSRGIFKVDAVDTTAAGDTFTGYFFGAISQGEHVSQALKIASMASAIAVSRQGAEPSIPYMEEVAERLNP